MKRIITAIAAALSLALMSACASTDGKHDQAREVLGYAKVAYIGATMAVSIYNRFEVCGPDRQPPLCYSEGVGEILDRAVISAGSAIQLAEDTLATLERDAAGQEKAAAIAKAAVEALLDALQRFGLARLDGPA